MQVRRRATYEPQGSTLAATIEERLALQKGDTQPVAVVRARDCQLCFANDALFDIAADEPPEFANICRVCRIQTRALLSNIAARFRVSIATVLADYAKRYLV